MLLDTWIFEWINILSLKTSTYKTNNLGVSDWIDETTSSSHHIRLLNNRQNAVAQTEMRGEKTTYKS